MKSIVLLLLALCCALARSAELQCGSAAVRITPEISMPLAGYYSTRLSEGVHDDLWAKALVIESGGERAAVVVCDLITMPRAVVVRARELIAAESGIPSARVMISATHTHTGPVLNTGSSRGPDETNAANVRAYTAMLPEKIAEAVRRANQSMVPARAMAGHEPETKVSHNRRYFMRDGTVGWNPGKLNTNIVGAAGPIDPDVGVLYFESPQTNAIAAYVNFAMHPDTAGGLMISADYPFTISRVLSAYKGSNMVTLFANGACGNINHVDVEWRDRQNGHAETARLGTILGADVLKAFTRMSAVKPGAVRGRAEMVSLDLPELKPGELESASNTIARIGGKPAPKFLEQVAAYKILDVAARGGEPQKVEVQVITLGEDVAWVALPGEIFVELGLAIKEQSPFRHTFIAELANGAIGYIPNSVAFEQGNYEPLSARCARGSGEKLRDTAITLLRQMKN